MVAKRPRYTAKQLVIASSLRTGDLIIGYGQIVDYNVTIPFIEYHLANTNGALVVPYNCYLEAKLLRFD